METTSKERIRNRIKNLFERTANILPSYKEKKIELDSCDEFGELYKSISNYISK
jgi:adenylate kinase family enzyme